MPVFEVTYEVSCSLRVRAKTAEEAIKIAVEESDTPFDERQWYYPEDDIIDAGYGDAHDFKAVEEDEEEVTEKQTEVKT